jgi:hypothetical protein
VARWVEQDPDVFLGLVGRQGGACLDGPGDGRLEVVDVDVEVLGDVLAAGFARPAEQPRVEGGERTRVGRRS